MCHYITLVVRGGGAREIDQVLRRHGRQAKLLANPSMARVLEPGEAHFLTTVGHCDCGTALVRAPLGQVGAPTQQAGRRAQARWSQAKIERWLSERQRADERAQKRRHANAPDSVDLWSRIVMDLMSTPRVQQAGLLVHFFAGDIEDEPIEAIRETVALRNFEAGLQTLCEDKLLMAK